ncbi:MAG: transporter substrate-binding domain-containing protein [Vicinamibacteria bacterium]|nr:transporter substrate-binding domain-containing protein [Vicinamibacteria bacterium]
MNDHTPRHQRGRRVAVFSLLLAGALLLLAGLSKAGDLDDVKARGKVVMLTFPAVEDPFVAVDLEAMRASGLKLADMRDPENFHGIDVELMKGFAQSLGVKLEIRPDTGGYGDLLPALTRGDGDLVASRLTITPKRREAADFSTPYFTQWIVAAVRPGSKARSIADLKGRKVAVMQGSSQLEFLPSLNLNPEVRVTGFNLETYNAVLEGEADYALMDSRAAVGESVSSLYSGIQVAVRLQEAGYGVMVRKGSDLKAPLDGYLDGLRKSGELEKILSRHGQGSEDKASVPAKR